MDFYPDEYSQESPEEAFPDRGTLSKRGTKGNRAEQAKRYYARNKSRLRSYKHEYYLARKRDKSPPTE